MQATFNVKAEKLKQFQELVKAFDIRFMRNPYIYAGKASVTISGEHLPMEKCNEFFATWDRMNRDIKEVPEKTKLQKFMKKIKKFI